MGRLDRRSKNRTIRSVRPVRGITRSQRFARSPRFLPPVVRLVRIQPRLVLDHLEIIRSGCNLLRTMERRREDSCDDDIGWVHSRTQHLVRQEIVGGPLERYRCMQRSVGRFCCDHLRVFGGRTVVGNRMWVRGFLGFDGVQQAGGEDEVRRPAGGGATPRRVRRVGVTLHGVVREGAVREGGVRGGAALRVVHGRRREVVGGADRPDLGDIRVGDGDDGTAFLWTPQAEVVEDLE
ncbi:hypothetical protein U1Q18_025833 [Sarracenia purpurea var. burkii]